jgi:hypothetical protein
VGLDGEVTEVGQRVHRIITCSSVLVLNSATASAA